MSIVGNRVTTAANSLAETVRQSVEFPEIKNQLGSYLHPDYDDDSGTVSSALFEAIRTSNSSLLLAELKELDRQPESAVREVLSDHAVEIFTRVTPRDLLKAMIVFTELLVEENEIRRRKPGAA